MKKNIVIAMVILVFAVAGCKDKAADHQSKDASKGGMTSQQAAGGNDPHAGLQRQEVPAGTPLHKGTVLSTMDAAGYTYVEVSENGQKLWVAAMQTKVKEGDEVEFPDSPPMQNFTSKTLNRTFDKIIFTSQLIVSGK